MKLNTEQQYAVDSTAKNILCLAGAGTGKTATMIQRIVKVAKEDTPDSILVLTFTNAAAVEMKHRYDKINKASSSPSFSTFHSLCYRLLCNRKEIRDYMHLSSVPSIPSDVVLRRAQREVISMLNISLSTKKLSGKVPLSLKEKREYDIYKKAVEQKLLSDNYITFDCLLESVCNLFIEGKIALPNIRHVFVDEFQDTDSLQWEFVRTFQDATKFLVGDALQSIYAFRGADNSIIKKLSVDPDWEVLKLHRNYRSTSEICEYANKFSRTYAGSRYAVEIDSERSGASVITKHVVTPYYAEQVSNGALAVVADSIKNNSQENHAVLARTNNEVAYIQDYLLDENIPLGTTQIRQDIESIFQSVRDNEFFADWASSCLSTEQYTDYIRLRKIADDDGSNESSLKLLSEKFSSNELLVDRMKLVMDIRSIVKKHVSVATKIENILSILNIKDVSITSSVPEGKSLGEHIQDSILEQTDASVYVGTIHSVKGLEYDNVYLLGVNGRNFKLQDEQNKNLYYVGITRAKNRLYVFEEV